VYGLAIDAIAQCHIDHARRTFEHLEQGRQLPNGEEVPGLT
jgi:hypothetical protein